ncbi:Peptidase S12 Pab87-related C-terminal [Penicillium nucicola]|uniref:Peptidase S12 Pab87-related C-terminal n=1 Tax=Penicillium nucicola TaxID=1850975 RepID=UPI0025455BA6|nr:Peptidase S12 Pab87-related C-terminal [Penicillium nucicola]KAJ5766949.1 Peptidase S12 Pab87-related C-terminal [Penicillium nucicola]
MAASWMQSPFDHEFDILVENELKKWKVPGLSISVVHGPNTYSKVRKTTTVENQALISVKAYGVAEVHSESDPTTDQPPTQRMMSTNTLFPTCSTTKAFTGAATSIVIQDSKSTVSPISWNTPLASLIPEDFSLEDASTTQIITLEDALSHRSGMPEHGWTLAFMPKNDITIQDTVRTMKHFPLASAPRTKYNYSNHMYIAVSHALEKHTGQPLGEIMKKRIWEPLGMHETFFSTKDAKADTSTTHSFAQGHDWVSNEEGGVFVPLPNNDWQVNSGAGAIVSNVSDYALWIRELIERKRPLEGHGSLIEPRTFHFQNDDLNIPAPYHAYALGWFVDHYRGHNFYSHPGGWPGFGSWVGFIPEKQFGFAIMGNSFSARYAAFRLGTYLLDKQLGMPYDAVHEGQINDCIARHSTEWHARLEKKTVEEAKRELYGTLLEPPIPHALPLPKYAGKYKHPSNISLTLKEHSESLKADLHDRVIPCELSVVHASGEFFVGTIHNRVQNLMPPFAVEFHIDVSGAVIKVGLLLEHALEGKKIWFERCEE